VQQADFSKFHAQGETGIPDAPNGRGEFFARADGSSRVESGQ
jgi:hypothetical protein